MQKKRGCWIYSNHTGYLLYGLGPGLLSLPPPCLTRKQNTGEGYKYEKHKGWWGGVSNSTTTFLIEPGISIYMVSIKWTGEQSDRLNLIARTRGKIGSIDGDPMTRSRLDSD